MEKNLIISNDENLKITNFKNAKRILINNLDIKNYSSLQDCIYDLYGTPLYNAIDKCHLRRILYGYFKNREFIRKTKLVNQLDDNIKSYNEFITKSHIINNNNINNINNNNNMLDLYEFYVYNRSRNFPKLSFKDIPDDISIEYYYFLLKQYDPDNLKEVCLEFYFFICDLYYEDKIYYKMDYKDLLPLVRDLKCFNILEGTRMSPENIYYCFIDKLEERFSKFVSEHDKRSIERYEETKEEGEI
ncbi:uncharacterized protein VNE69_03116 [Vairimorpha necatrix]|uniref:Uncharacterized protein n=1 Tax=Vairimorpha necatrix TaxID=6039 RepID=A0AAX4JAA9_9MICR